MRKRRLNFGRPDSVTSLLVLVALLFQAYVPVGFMPAGGRPFLLELCPAYQTRMPAHHGHHASDTHAHFENCPFGSAPAVGPIAHIVAFAPPVVIDSPSNVAFDRLLLVVRPARANRPRGPPVSLT